MRWYYVKVRILSRICQEVNMHGCLTLSNNHQGEKLMWNGEMRTLILIKKAMICSKEVWCIMACLFAFWFIMLIYSFPFCRLYCLSSMSKYFARCHQDAASTAPLIIKKSLHFFIFYLKNSQYFFFFNWIQILTKLPLNYIIFI